MQILEHKTVSRAHKSFSYKTVKGKGCPCD